MPILLGTNSDEGTTFIHGLDHNATEAQFDAYLTHNFGPVYAPLVRAQYPVSNYESPWWTASAIVTDSFMACPARFTARTASRAYLYQFTHVLDELLPWDEYLGVFHAAELVRREREREFCAHEFLRAVFRVCHSRRRLLDAGWNPSAHLPHAC